MKFTFIKDFLINIYDRFGITANEWLYNMLWKNKKMKMFGRSMFIALPFLFMFAFYLILEKNNVWLAEYTYGFLNDITNVGVFTYIFPTLFYVSGWYSAYSENIVKNFKNKIQDSNKDEFKKCKPFFHLVSILFMFASFFFINTADENGKYNWYYLLSDYELLYYKILIAMCWYMSVNVILNTLHTAVKVYGIAQFKVNIETFHYDKSGGIADVYLLLFWNIGLVIFFLISFILIIISDYRALSFNVLNAFMKYPILIFGVVLLFVIYLSITIIPFVECRRLITEKIKEEILTNKYNNEEINKIKQLKYSMFNLKNIMNFLIVNFMHIIYIINVIKEALSL